MANIFNISQVNYKYVFFKNNDRLAMNRATAELLYNSIKVEQAFYNRMYDEMSVMLDEKKAAVDAKKEQTETDLEVIRKLPIDEKAKAEVARDYYLADVHALQGMYETLSKINDKRNHCDKLMSQIDAVLKVVK